MNEINALAEIGNTARSVVQAVLPLLIILVLFQVFFMKLPGRYIWNLVIGTVISACGLFLFLQGVQSGFLPFGRAIGEAAGEFSQRWLVIPLGFSLGFLTTWSEPAVRVLCDQVEDASSGSIRKQAVLITVCLGVAVFVALGMVRVVYQIPLLYLLLPGYVLAVTMLWVTEKDFVGIAFDAGGVATGPLANTFLLGVGLGLASSAGNDDMLTYGLGLVSLIALAPILSVMILGIIFRIRIRMRE